MSKDRKERDGKPANAAAKTGEGAPLEELMASGAVPKAPARNLGAEALAAAADVVPPQRPAETPLAAPRHRDRMLRGLLILNLALIGVTLALPWGRQPETTTPATPAGAADSRAAPAEGAPAARPKTLGLQLAQQPYYERSLELAAAGDLDGAIGTLELYLQKNPDLADVEKRLVLHALAMFAVRAGRIADANRFEREMEKLRTMAQLPQDLLAAAEQAELEGRGADARRHYARFLLMQKQVPPSLRARIAEAYLKLGDGYRLEAEDGARREAAAVDKNAAANNAVEKAPPPTEPPGGRR